MEFSKEQLNILSNSFAREKMQKASDNPRSKRPRINKHYYEKVDITTVISESTTLNNTAKKALLNNIDKLEIVAINKRPYTYVFGKKIYINKSEMDCYKGFTIYFE